MSSRIIRPIVRHGRGFELCKSWVTPKYLAMQLIIGWGGGTRSLWLALVHAFQNSYYVSHYALRP